MLHRNFLVPATRASAVAGPRNDDDSNPDVPLRFAYLILAHANPKHLERLIGSLASPAAWFFVHLDRKAELRRFEHLAGDRVTFTTRRHDCAWGNISLVDATLELVDDALRSDTPFDYHVLLSGACYPIRSTDYIEAFFARHAGTEFIDTIPMPNDRYGKPMTRLTKWFIPREAPFAQAKWKLQALLHRLLPDRDWRRHFQNLVPVAGSQWWALTDAAVRHVVRFVSERPDLYRFCRRADCPDELIFQTALYNSPFRPRLSHSLTFTHWTPGRMGPEAIDHRFVDRFRAARVLDSESNNSPNEKREVLFARKFTDASAQTVDAIDAIRANPVVTA